MKSVIEMPQCALCDQQAWTWVFDRAQQPYLQIALCKDHAPNGAAMYTMASVEAVRNNLKEKGSVP